jgi:hypothetical protein
MEEMRGLGAPALPDGHYYRVRSNEFGMIWVYIMKERKYLWNKSLMEARGKRYDTNDVLRSPDEVVYCAATTAHNLWKEKTPEQLWWSEFKEWEGDHK